MSAVSSSGNVPDLEELRRAQRAHEPFMQEILASLRTIIADDKELLSRADPPTAPQRLAAAAAGPQIVYSSAAPAPQREDAAAPGPVALRSRLELANSAAAPEGPREEPNEEPSQEPSEEEPLLSPAAEEAVTSAFNALSADLAARRAEVADEMIRELLRPMLKAWLDENLPGIVEPLVRAEISRLARGPRAGALR